MLCPVTAECERSERTIIDWAPLMVHIEHHRSSAFLYDSEDVTAFETAAKEVRRVAMIPEGSSRLIADAISEQEMTG